MPRPHVAREGTRAKFGRRTIHYSPFAKRIPKSYVLVSDPWGYLRVFLQKKKSERKKFLRRYEDAEHFVNLARDYFQASLEVQSLTSALLLYYGYLNLSKAYLSLQGVSFGRISEAHGLSIAANSTQVRIFPRSANQHNIFAELMFHLKQINITQQQVIGAERFLRVLPEIHEIGFASEAFKKRHFVRVDVSLWQSQANRTVWYRVSISQSDRHLIPNLYARFYRGYRKQLLWQTQPDEKNLNFESRVESHYNSSTREVYQPLCAAINQMPIFSLLTRDGYRQYVLLRSWPFDQIGASLLSMFWLGSLVRYRPKSVKAIMDSVLGAALAEFVAINPTQFVYQMTNYITGSECVKPYAQL